MRYLRTFALASSGLVFGTIGLLALAAPIPVARAYGFVLPGVDAFNEFRAVYTGFWLALAAAMITAARRPDVPLLGDLCGLMLLLQAAGRVVSLAVDGVPAPQFVAAMFAEASAAAAILVAPRLARSNRAVAS
ncbi:MAG TPA: DUF4345 family protein [Labilithrix sp.]|jgi:hypothetical protein